MDEDKTKLWSFLSLRLKWHREGCGAIIPVKELGTVERAFRVRHVSLGKIFWWDQAEGDGKGFEFWDLR